jgi:hypothetical protein
MDAGGKYHPCMMIISVDPSLQTASVTGAVQLDSDLLDPPDFEDGSAMDLYSHNDGHVFAAWRDFRNQAPVARFFGPDGEPLSDTFWVSTLGADDWNSGETTIKCAVNRKIAAVAWLSESFDPGLNCKGGQMERDTVVRAFHAVWGGETPTPRPTSTLTPTATSTATYTPLPTFASERSDIDGSGEVDAIDLLIFLRDWKRATTP